MLQQDVHDRRPAHHGCFHQWRARHLQGIRSTHLGVKHALPWRVLQKQKQQNEQKTAVNFAQNFGGFVRADCERQLLQGVWHPANPSQLGPIP